MTFKIEILSFMTKVSQNKGNETKSGILDGTYSNVTNHWSQNTEIFQLLL